MIGCRMQIQRIILVTILLLTWLGGYAQNSHKPKIALVLSGGGAKGFAHIGVLKVLEKEGVPIDIIVGTSMGAVVGGLYSIGYKAAEIEHLARTENWDKLLSDDISRVQSSQSLKENQQRYLFSLPVNKKHQIESPQAAIQGQNIINLFSDLAGNVPDNPHFDSFPIRFACEGTDVGTGKEVVIHKGFLPTAIYASMTIPGVFVPIEHDGRTMIDGGVVNNFPTDVAKRMGADIIIGVDIRSGLRNASEIKSIKDLLNQLIDFYSTNKDSLNKSYCSVIIRPDITGYDASSFYPEAVDSLINRGAFAAQSMLTEIQKLKKDYGLTPREVDRRLVKRVVWPITKIKINGNQSLSEKLLLDNLQLKTPGDYTYKELKDAIDRVYGLGGTEKVYFVLKDDGRDEKILDLNVVEKKTSSLSLGMRLNTTDAVSLLVNYSRKDFKEVFSNYSVFANISTNPELKLSSEFSKGKMPVVGVQLKGKYRSYHFYANGSPEATSEIFYGSGSMYLHQAINKVAHIESGVKMELFDGTFFNASSDSAVVVPKSTSAILNAYACFSKDNLDDYYFPTHGSEIYVEISVDKDMRDSRVSPAVLFKNRNVIKISNRINLLLNAHGRALLTEHTPLVKQTFIGGHDYELYFNNHLPFYGIPPVMPSKRFAAVGLVGLQLRLYQKNYVSALINGLVQNESVDKSQSFQSELGWAFDYKYNSMIGPVGFTVGYSPWYNKPVISANVGMWF